MSQSVEVTVPASSLVEAVLIKDAASAIRHYIRNWTPDQGCKFVVQVEFNPELLPPKFTVTLPLNVSPDE